MRSARGAGAYPQPCTRCNGIQRHSSPLGSMAQVRWVGLTRRHCCLSEPCVVGLGASAQRVPCNRARWRCLATAILATAAVGRSVPRGSCVEQQVAAASVCMHRSGRLLLQRFDCGSCGGVCPAHRPAAYFGEVLLGWMPCSCPQCVSLTRCQPSSRGKLRRGRRGLHGTVTEDRAAMGAVHCCCCRCCCSQFVLWFVCGLCVVCVDVGVVVQRGVCSRRTASVAACGTLRAAAGTVARAPTTAAVAPRPN